MYTNSIICGNITLVLPQTLHAILKTLCIGGKYLLMTHDIILNDDVM